MAKKAREAAKRWRERNPKRAEELDKIKYLRNKFGISVFEYDELFRIQGGKCSICNQAETIKSRGIKTNNLAVDHCHTTGKIRGLLCFRCNVMLAQIERHKDILKRIKEYLDAEQ